METIFKSFFEGGAHFEGGAQAAPDADPNNITRRNQIGRWLRAQVLATPYTRGESKRMSCEPASDHRFYVGNIMIDDPDPVNYPSEALIAALALAINCSKGK
jgi:hypothetical protein